MDGEYKAVRAQKQGGNRFGMLQPQYTLKQLIEQAIRLYFSTDGKNGFEEDKEDVHFSLVCGNYVDEELNLEEDVHVYLQTKQLAKGRTSFILRSIAEDKTPLPNPAFLGGTEEAESSGDESDVSNSMLSDNESVADSVVSDATVSERSDVEEDVDEMNESPSSPVTPTEPNQSTTNDHSPGSLSPEPVGRTR